MEFLPRNPRRRQMTAGSDCVAGAVKEDAARLRGSSGPSL